MKALLPKDEERRLGILRSYNILDTPCEQPFDDLAMLAAHICQTPMALISFVDQERQWFKARIGIGDTEMRREIAFCAHAILNSDEVLEVRDAKADPRFAENPLVAADPHVRFYAGAPLASPAGPAVGTICVLDRRARALTSDQKTALRALSRQVISQLELRQPACHLVQTSTRGGSNSFPPQDGPSLRSDGTLEEVSEETKSDKLRLALLSLVEDERLALNKLQLSEERFRELADNVNEVFWITDPTMQEVIYVSPAYEKIWGQSCSSLSASPAQWFELIHPEDRKRIRRIQADVVGFGRAETDYRLLLADGAERWIHDKRFAVRNAAGEICRIVGVAVDITEKRDLEQKLRQSQKMESIGQMAGGIAHDFNNILAAIRGNIDLIIADATGNPGILESAHEISQATRRATDLVKQILSFSRQGRQELGLVRLETVVQEALKLLRASVPSSIVICSNFGSGATVLADSTAIHQVIMNLGTNAWHAMRGAPGSIRVDMDVSEQDAEFVRAHPGMSPGRYVRLSVSDTGTGMDRATQQRIFEPFFTTKPIGEGTGLGLAVVHGIVKSHGGAIAVSSERGRGTRFDVFFPVLDVEMASAQTECAPILRGHGEHVLLVDDEAVLAEIGKRRLERMGYVVTTKTSPADAIAALRAHPHAYNVVITDLGMPGMDGVKLGGELLLIQPRLAMILTTGFGGAITEENVEEFGFKALLTKPSTEAALGKVVHDVLRSGKQSW